MTRRRALAAATFAAWAFASPAAAYVRSSDPDTGEDWFWPVPTVSYDLSSAPSHPSPSCAASASGDPVADAVRASFSTWQQSCSDLRLVYGGRIAEIRTGLAATPENLVVVRHGWCSTQLPPQEPCMLDPDVDCAGIYNCFEDHGDHTTIALTTVVYDPTTGRIFDADIELNGWDGDSQGTPILPVLPNGQTLPPPHGFYFTCDAPGRPVCVNYGDAGCNGYDLQNTVTHEAGHFIGLAHPCEGKLACQQAPPPGETVPYDQRTMYPYADIGETSKRTLSADDVAGVCAVYPKAGCGSAGGAPGALAVVLAALALRPRLTRRARPRTPRPGACRR